MHFPRRHLRFNGAVHGQAEERVDPPCLGTAPQAQRPVSTLASV